MNEVLDIKAALRAVGIQFVDQGLHVAVLCPRQHLQAFGIAQQDFLFNPATGFGECRFGGCGLKLNLPEYMKECGFDYKSESRIEPIPRMPLDLEAEKQSYQPSHRASSPIRIVPWSEFEKQPFPENPWRVKGLIPLNGMTIIAAPSGEKKSWVVMELARCVAEGISFLGDPQFATEKCNVLYVENETPENEIQRRGKVLGFGEGILMLRQECPPLNSDAAVGELFEMAVVRKVGMVIIDTVRSVAGGMREEKAEEIRMFFDRFKKFCAAGITVIFTDHCRKPHQLESKTMPKKEQLLGSQDKVAAVHALIMIRSERNSDEILVHPLKLKAGRERGSFKIVMKDNEDESSISLTYAGDIEEEKLKIEETKELVKSLLANAEGPIDSPAVLEGLRGKTGKTMVENALKSMRQTNEIGWRKVGRKFVYFVGSDEEEQVDGDEKLPPLDEVPDRLLGS